MATLQKLRNMGPLLVIFVGLALFAFIAGDAWRLFDSNANEASVGSIDDETLSAADFQQLYTECQEAQKMFKRADPRLSQEQKLASFTEEESAMIKEEAWGVFVQSALTEKQASAAGLAVTDDEVTDIITNNSSAYLNSIYHPFRTETGFNTEMLNEVISVVNGTSTVEYPAEVLAEYNSLYLCWKYMEKRIKLEALMNKQVKFFENGSIANPVLANRNFNLNNNTYNLEVVAFPFTSIADSTITVTDEEIEEYYNENKDYLYKQEIDTRDIKYISVKVSPSESDRNALLAEMQEYTDSLKAGNLDRETIIRLSRSELGYNDLMWTKESFTEDIQLRIEAAAVDSVVGPYYNPSDNTFNTFVTTGKAEAPDSLMIRLIVINSQSMDEVNATADSLMAALKNKGDFKELAKNYAHADSLWVSSRNFFSYGIVDNATSQSEIYNAPKGEYKTTEFETIPGKMIYQVIEKKGKATVYSIAAIKREVTFSSATYDKAYNELSSLIASCSNIDELDQKAIEKNFRVMKENEINATTKTIGNVPGSYELVKWILSSERTAGEFSKIEECAGEYLLFAAINRVTPKGYLPLDKEVNNYGTTFSDLIKSQLLQDKKAATLSEAIYGKDYDAIKAEKNAKVSTVSMVEYKKPTHIASINADEPVISAVAANMNEGEVSAPIKGNRGVYVIKVLGKSAKNGQFNAEVENEYVLSNGGLYNYAQIAAQLYNMGVQDIYPVENHLYRYF